MSIWSSLRRTPLAVISTHWSPYPPSQLGGSSAMNPRNLTEGSMTPSEAVTLIGVPFRS